MIRYSKSPLVVLCMPAGIMCRGSPLLSLGTTGMDIRLKNVPWYDPGPIQGCLQIKGSSSLSIACLGVRLWLFDCERSCINKDKLNSPSVTAIEENFVDPPSSDPILSLADQETVLPCRYQPDAGVQVVQVTWYKEHSDGTKEQIITAHHTNGQTGQFLSSRAAFLWETHSLRHENPFWHAHSTVKTSGITSRFASSGWQVLVPGLFSLSWGPDKA